MNEREIALAIMTNNALKCAGDNVVNDISAHYNTFRKAGVGEIPSALMAAQAMKYTDGKVEQEMLRIYSELEKKVK